MSRSSSSGHSHTTVVKPQHSSGKDSGCKGSWWVKEPGAFSHGLIQGCKAVPYPPCAQTARPLGGVAFGALTLDNKEAQ